MSVTQVSSAPSREVYDTVLKHVDLAGNRPKGLILHAASELASGEIQIIDVYESRDALRTFEQSSLFPAFAAAGLGSDAQNGVLPESYEPFDLVV